MKFLLPTIFLACSISTANAGPSVSKMATFASDFNYFSRRVPMQKRFVHTQLKTKGFRPEKQIEATEWHTLKLPEKVEYIDATHETFKTPPGFLESIEKSLRSKGVEQSSNLRDSLKKK